VLVRRLALTLSGLALSSVVACSAFPGSDDDASSDGLSIPGRWELPSSVAAAGEAVRLHYDGAPAWGSAKCAGKLKSGAMRLGEYLQDRYPAITSIGGYACRRNTASASKMSVHGTGRALDVFIPTIKGAADNGKGDPLANWLVANAEHIGIQLVIWDRTVWQSNGRGAKAYTGPVPHVDHLHVELTLKAAAQQTPWFLEGDAGAPDLEDPEATPPANEGEDGDVEPEVDPESAPADAGAAAPPEADAGASADAAAGTAPPPADPGPPEPVPAAEDQDEPPPIEDEPREGESTGITSRRSSPAATRDALSGSAGCSAAPARTTGGVALPVGLALAACVVLRRRRG
jgi:hypothetical protein